MKKKPFYDKLPWHLKVRQRVINLNYYDECLAAISDLMQKKEYISALKLIESELSMPYVPADSLTKLKLAYKECQFKVKENEPVRSLSPEEIENALHSNEECQIMAVNALNKCNLRDMLDIVKEYLFNEHSAMAGALLMESLIKQQISEEITVKTDQGEITFIPRYTELPYESDGFLQAQKLLEQWFLNEDAGLYQLCMQILIQEAYLAMPINYEGDESLILALSITRYVFDCMGKTEEFNRFMKEKELNCSFFLDLKCILL